MSIKKILITGSSGLLGTYLTPLLCEYSYTVYSLGRHPLQGFSHSNYYHISSDLLVCSDLESLIPPVDCIIHCAQSRDYSKFPDSASDVFSINTNLTVQLASLAFKRNINKFIYTSTGSIYRNSLDPLTETSPLKSYSDCDFYSASKLSSELLLSQFSKYISSVVVFRPFFMYGKSRVRSMLIPRLFDNVLNRKIITLQGKHGFTFNPIHAFDAAYAILESLSLANSCTFNLAGPSVVSLKEVVDSFGSHLSIHPRYEFNDTPASAVIASIDQLSNLLYTPTKSILDPSSIKEIRL